MFFSASLRKYLSINDNFYVANKIMFEITIVNHQLLFRLQGQSGKGPN